MINYGEAESMSYANIMDTYDTEDLTEGRNICICTCIKTILRMWNVQDRI